MLPFANLLSINRDSSVAVYQQLANQLVGLVRQGVLTPGMKLPSSRELATLIGVHRKTIVAAYNEIALQGWLVSEPKKGIYISSVLPELNPKSWAKQTSTVIAAEYEPFYYPVNAKTIAEPSADFYKYDLVIDDGLPDPRLAPFELLTREYKNRIKKNIFFRGGANTFSAGSLSLRETLTAYLADTRGIQANIKQLLVTQGAQMGIYIAANLLLRPGDCVIVGEPGYFMANSVFESLGAKIIRVPVDEDGLIITQVEEACSNHKINMLYVIPHHHHPTTVTLSPQRRMQLISLAERFNFAIVEDDYDYDFHYQSSPYLPLISSCNNRIIYIGSLTKCLASSIRVGFMVAPSNIINEAVKIRRQINLRGDFVMEDALAALIGAGDIGRHIKKSVSIYRERRDYISFLINDHLTDFLDFEIPAGGMALWLKFKTAYAVKRVAKDVSKQGLLMSDGTKYNTADIDYNAIRFGFASLKKEELAAIVQILKNTLNAY